MPGLVGHLADVRLLAGMSIAVADRHTHLITQYLRFEQVRGFFA